VGGRVLGGGQDVFGELGSGARRVADEGTARQALRTEADLGEVADLAEQGGLSAVAAAASAVGQTGAMKGTRTPHAAEDFGVSPFHEGGAGGLGEDGAAEVQSPQRFRSSGRRGGVPVAIVVVVVVVGGAAPRVEWNGGKGSRGRVVGGIVHGEGDVAVGQRGRGGHGGMTSSPCGAGGSGQGGSTRRGHGIISLRYLTMVLGC